MRSHQEVKFYIDLLYMKMTSKIFLFISFRVLIFNSYEVSSILRNGHKLDVPLMHVTTSSIYIWTLLSGTTLQLLNEEDMADDNTIGLKDEMPGCSSRERDTSDFSRQTV